MTTPKLYIKQSNVMYQGNGNYKVNITSYEDQNVAKTDAWVYSTPMSFTGQILSGEAIENFSAGIIWGDGITSIFNHEHFIEDKTGNTWKIYFRFIPQSEHIYKSGYIYSCTYQLYSNMRGPYYYLYNNHHKYEIIPIINNIPLDFRFYNDNIFGGIVRITDEKVTQSYTTISLFNRYGSINTNAYSGRVRLEVIEDRSFSSMNVTFGNGETKSTTYTGTSGMILTYDYPPDASGTYTITVTITKIDNTTVLYTQDVTIYPYLIDFDPTVDPSNITAGDTVPYIITDHTNITKVEWKNSNGSLLATGFSANYITISSWNASDTHYPDFYAHITLLNGSLIKQQAKQFALKSVDVPQSIDIQLGPKRFILNGEMVTFYITEPLIASTVDWYIGSQLKGTGTTFQYNISLYEPRTDLISHTGNRLYNGKVKFNAYTQKIQQYISEFHIGMSQTAILVTNYVGNNITFDTPFSNYFDCPATWNFGDGHEFATIAPFTYTYENTGTYTVSMNYVIDGISRTATKSNVKVTDATKSIKSVDFFANVTSGYSPMTVTFAPNVISTFPIQSLIYDWNFGDGNSSNTRGIVQHTYTCESGVATYDISLNVSALFKNENETRTKVGYITVSTYDPVPPSPDTATVTINVSGITGCNIYIDGVQYPGFNPITVKLSPGTYTFDASKTGYSSTKVTQIITANQIITVYISLTQNVSPPPPSSFPSWSTIKDLATNGRAIKFTVPSQSISASWNTGDGHARISGKTIEYIYSKYGKYYVTCYWEE